MKPQYILILILTTIVYNINGYSQCGAGYNSGTRKTPKNSTINVCVWNGSNADISISTSNAIKNAALDYWGDDPKFECIGNATSKYNCHAYAWHISEGGDQVWINTPNDDKYWNDGSYVETTNESEAIKVSYGDCNTCATIVCWDPYNLKFYSCTRCGSLCDHSAITTTDNGYFISKWGAFPLFKHHKNDMPYLIQPGGLRYFKRCEDNYSGQLSSNIQSVCNVLLTNVTIQNNVNIEFKDWIKINGTFNVPAGTTLNISPNY